MRRPFVPRSRLGAYGENPNVTPRSGQYNERDVFNAYGAEGGQVSALANIPKRRFAQFSFNADAAGAMILPANDRRFYLVLQNKSTADIIYFGFGAAVDANSGIALIPGTIAGGGGNYLGDYNVPTDSIWVFAANPALAVCGEGVWIE